MGSTFDGVDERLSEWIARQPLFFVATAPLRADGHINASPKGPIGSLRVLDPTTVAYLDLTGSGAETVAHLRENGRIVIMLCAFEGPPRIVRLHGRGEAISPDDPRFDDLLARCRFAEPEVEQARRAIVRVEVTRVADSCGYGVPLMRYEGERPHMDAWASKRLRSQGEDALMLYRAQKNARSIDGLPAVEPRSAR
jgi:Pyridoxamine 5'-phosphate oxidase